MLVGYRPDRVFAPFPPAFLNPIACNFAVPHPEPHTKLNNTVNLHRKG